jgi:predicted aspartyl protease
MYRALVALALCLAVPEAGAGECPIPLEPTGTAFVTTVRIGSEGPLRFLVDTGATITVIERSVAQRIGLQPTRTIEAISTTGTLDVQEAMVDELRAGNVSIVHTPALITVLPQFANHGHLDGILGMSFFAGRAVHLDIRRRCAEVDVAPPRGMTLDAHEVVGRVAVEIEGFNFILDSGASFPVLTSTHARALAVEEGGAEITSAAGRRRMSTATIPVLRIGRMIFRDVAVALAPARDPREDGLFPITPFSSIYIAADRKSVVIE